MCKLKATQNRNVRFVGWGGVGAGGGGGGGGGGGCYHSSISFIFQSLDQISANTTTLDEIRRSLCEAWFIVVLTKKRVWVALLALKRANTDKFRGKILIVWVYNVVSSNCEMSAIYSVWLA